MIFPSTLIVSTSSKDSIAKINSICKTLKNPFNINNPDILIIGDHQNWTINDIRHSQDFFAKKPFNHQNKILIIYQADQLGIPAQNALLKTLEDPGKNNYLLLSSARPQSLLSTIISRCHIIRLQDTSPVNLKSLIPISPDPAENLTTSDQLSVDKNSILPLIKKELYIQQNNLVRQPNQSTKKLIKKLIHSIRLITHNVDPRSALDYYLLSS